MQALHGFSGNASGSRLTRAMTYLAQARLDLRQLLAGVTDPEARALLAHHFEDLQGVIESLVRLRRMA